MDNYQVVITPDASEDLIGIKNYIAVTLNEPQTALKYIRSLKEKIESLVALPNAYTLVDDEPWRSRGILKFLHKRFLVYYRVDDNKKCVYILNVIYARRNQLDCLSRYE